MKKKAYFLLILLIVFLFSPLSIVAQKKSVFQSGEKLIYKVKYGFVKLGTLIVETGEPLGGSRIKSRMKFWTAQVPFLDSKDIIDDIIDTTGVCVIRIDEHGHDGETKMNRTFDYNVSAKTVTYSDDSVKNLLYRNVNPFSDAMTLFFNLRSWNGSRANYYFPLWGRTGEQKVKCSFSRIEEKQECPAFDDKEILSYRIDGFADLGSKAPLGASGKFTAWVTEDEASIPLRIDMNIAIGSISLVLDKVQRTNWEPLTTR